MQDFKREVGRILYILFLKIHCCCYCCLSQFLQKMSRSDLGCHCESSHCSRDTSEQGVSQTYWWHRCSEEKNIPNRLGKAIRIALLLPRCLGTIATEGCLVCVVLPLKWYSEILRSIPLPSWPLQTRSNTILKPLGSIISSSRTPDAETVGFSLFRTQTHLFLVARPASTDDLSLNSPSQDTPSSRYCCHQKNHGTGKLRTDPDRPPWQQSILSFHFC